MFDRNAWRKRWRHKNRFRLREESREYYRKNKKQAAETHRKWRLKNLKRRSEDMKKWRSRNRRHHLKYQRAYIAKLSPEKRKEYALTKLKWQRNNRGKIGSWRHARRVRMIGSGGTRCRADIEKIRIDQKDRCLYCSTALAGKGSIDHKTPIKLFGTNWPSNLALCCALCNSRKGIKPFRQFMRQMRKERGGDPRLAV